MMNVDIAGGSSDVAATLDPQTQVIVLVMADAEAFVEGADLFPHRPGQRDAETDHAAHEYDPVRFFASESLGDRVRIGRVARMPWVEQLRVRRDVRHGPDDPQARVSLKLA